jgi:protein-S-isoprenylcysteine O-methyltransferase Ste14
MHSISNSGTAAPMQSSVGRWQIIADRIVYRRVRITLALFASLLTFNVVTGIAPRGLFAYDDPAAVAGCMLIFAGLGLRSWSAGILRKNRELTTTGPYALVRNPLYLGSFLIMCGFCTMINNAESIVYVLGPIAGLYLLQVLQEEREMARLFPLHWPAYSRSTPRFLPRSLPKAAFAPWDARQWLGSREYNALGATLLGMLAVELWRLS